MNYPAFRIEGAILSPDLLDRLEEARRPEARLTLASTPSSKVKDEIARAWADAQDYWRIFQRKLDALKPDNPRDDRDAPAVGAAACSGCWATSWSTSARRRTRQRQELHRSHRIANRGATPIHIIGCREPSGPGPQARVSAVHSLAAHELPHAMVQEYLNLQDELYGIVTNGRVLRLLRDSIAAGQAHLSGI
jgi:hypothetical protein